MYYFKKVIGDNFKNYLSIYRIEKSKEIMQENNGLRIKDLAELVGYNSSNTFIRTFKNMREFLQENIFWNNRRIIL